MQCTLNVKYQSSMVYLYIDNLDWKSAYLNLQVKSAHWHCPVHSSHTFLHFSPLREKLKTRNLFILVAELSISRRQVASVISVDGSIVSRRGHSLQVLLSINADPSPYEGEIKFESWLRVSEPSDMDYWASDCYCADSQGNNGCQVMCGQSTDERARS